MLEMALDRDRCEVSLLTNWEKKLCTFQNRPSNGNILIVTQYQYQLELVILGGNIARPNQCVSTWNFLKFVSIISKIWNNEFSQIQGFGIGIERSSLPILFDTFFAKIAPQVEKFSPYHSPACNSGFVVACANVLCNLTCGTFINMAI